MENQEKWMELCALASKEQDPAKGCNSRLGFMKESFIAMPVALLDEVALSLVFHRSGQIPQDLPMSGGSPLAAIASHHPHPVMK
jgi:hypothetical protein